MNEALEFVKGPYIVWAHYGSEGWNAISADSFHDAMQARDQKLRNGGQMVVITKRVEFETTEVTK